MSAQSDTRVPTDQEYSKTKHTHAQHVWACMAWAE